MLSKKPQCPSGTTCVAGGPLPGCCLSSNLCPPASAPTGPNICVSYLSNILLYSTCFKLAYRIFLRNSAHYHVAFSEVAESVSTSRYCLELVRRKIWGKLGLKSSHYPSRTLEMKFHFFIFHREIYIKVSHAIVGDFIKILVCQ
jgi:hypothetical protein